MGTCQGSLLDDRCFAKEVKCMAFNVSRALKMAACQGLAFQRRVCCCTLLFTLAVFPRPVLMPCGAIQWHGASYVMALHVSEAHVTRADPETISALKGC